MNQLSTADISIDEAAIYCCLFVLINQLSTVDICIDVAISTADIGIDEAAIYTTAYQY